LSTTLTFGHSARFKTGRVLLLAVAALMTLNHAVLIVAFDEPVLFLGYAAFNLYALLVIAIPFRRRERWAWYTTWILPIGLAAPAVGDPNIALFYFAFAAICGLGLLLTMQEFFAKHR
jgi:hypothetical protein